jgi:hypothetical protein
MKNRHLTIIVLVLMLFTLIACNKPATNESAESAEKVESPDYAAFDKKVEVIRSFAKAHTDEDMNALKELLSDTLKWSPPYYNGNKWLGKEDYLTVLQNYQNDYENIKFTEGIVLPDTLSNGMWSGSVFPKDNASNKPGVIRIYGTWTAKHTDTGKEIGVKWFALGSINNDGKIVQMNEYFDAHGIAAQIAEE